MKERFKVVPAVYIFLEKDGGILLTRRYNTGYKDGEYMVPSGHVEKGESLRDAMIREAMEEVGVTVRREDMELVHVMYRAAEDATGERADFFFKPASWKGEPRNCEPHKCDEVAWFPLDRLPENTVGYLTDAISAARRGVSLLEMGWEL